MAETFNIIVVGAGSAGGVAAARLSEDSWRCVLFPRRLPGIREHHDVGLGREIVVVDAWRDGRIAALDRHAVR